MEYKRIRELREDFDRKQKEIAEKLNITQQQYQLYESGKRSLPIDYLTILARIYNVSTDYILRINKSKITLSSLQIE